VRLLEGNMIDPDLLQRKILVLRTNNEALKERNERLKNQLAAANASDGAVQRALFLVADMQLVELQKEHKILQSKLEACTCGKTK
jgi:hypothetical protein